MDNAIMSSLSSNFSSSSAILIVLDMDHLVEEILSRLRVGDLELLRYRLVNRKWNDIIVRKNTKSRDFFQVKLRYGHGIPRFINQSDAQRWACEILESTTRALTSAAAATVTKFPFDSLLIDRDFFLAGLLPQWTNFMKVYGKTIRHLKIDIRSGKFPGQYVNYVSDCEVIVTSECLRAIFRAVPNLESLDFCARFCHYGSVHPSSQNINPIFRNSRDIPKLKKLTKITLQEPHKDEYSAGFVKEILSMSPKLSSLYIKPARTSEVFATALKKRRMKIHSTLRTLKISNANAFCMIHFRESDMMHFPSFNLTRLEIDNFDSSGNIREWIEKLLKIFQSTLVTLILGNRVREKCYHPNIGLDHLGLNFPSVMKSLKVFEINCSKFKLNRILNYQERFPVLENFTVTNYAEKENVWVYPRISHLLPGDSGKSITVKTFSLLGKIQEIGQGQIVQGISTTFPMAQQIFGL